MFYNSLVKTRMEMALLVMQKKKSVWFCHKHDWTYPEVSLRKPSLGSLERFPAFDEKEKKKEEKKKKQRCWLSNGGMQTGTSVVSAGATTTATFGL